MTVYLYPFLPRRIPPTHRSRLIGPKEFTKWAPKCAKDKYGFIPTDSAAASTIVTLITGERSSPDGLSVLREWVLPTLQPDDVAIVIVEIKEDIHLWNYRRMTRTKVLSFTTLGIIEPINGRKHKKKRGSESQDRPVVSVSGQAAECYVPDHSPQTDKQRPKHTDRVPEWH